jgi:hypothetical protein
MTVVQDDLAAQITADLGRVRRQLTQAQHRQRVKDSETNRAAVAECRARIDVVLDLFLETSRGELSTVPPEGASPDPGDEPRPASVPAQATCRPR